MPLRVNQAWVLDKSNSDTKWQDAIRTELSQLDELKFFRLLAEAELYLRSASRYHITLSLMSSLTWGTRPDLLWMGTGRMWCVLTSIWK